MTLKSIKEKFEVFKRDGLFHLYSLTETGRMSPRKYLCTIHKHSATKFFVTGFEPTDKIDVLLKQVQDKLDSYEYCCEFYCPTYRKGVFEEFVIHDYLVNTLGFKSAGGKETYKLKDKNIYGFQTSNIEISIWGLDSFNDVFDKKKPADEVEVVIWTGDWSWISHKCKRNVEDIKKGIDGLLKPLLATDAVTLMLRSEKMKTVEDFDIVLRKLHANLDTSTESIKAHMKKQLIELAEKL